MFEKIPTHNPEKLKEPEKRNAKGALKKFIVGGMAAGMIVGAAEQTLAARDATTEFQDRKSTEHKTQESYGQKEQKRIEDKFGGKVVMAKAEKQEKLQLFVSGTIDGKDKFEIYKTNYNPDDDKELSQAKKDALEAYGKSHSMEDLKKYRMLNKVMTNKEFKIYINGKEARVMDSELLMDGGSSIFKTDLGNFLIAVPWAKDFKSSFSTPGGKQHPIQINQR